MSLRAWCIVLLLIGGLTARASTQSPPRFDFDFEAAALGGYHADGSNAGGNGRSDSVSATWLCHHPAGLAGLYWTTGIEADHYDFAGGGIQRLQDYALVAGFDYYRRGEKAASLTLRPGYYFGRRSRPQAWDIPVQLVSGVPLRDPVNGVLGFANARFYHHPLPIFGLEWKMSPHWRLQAVYPEPALEYAPSDDWAWRFGGQLVGDGFLVDVPGRTPTPVEYSSYRVGLGLTRTLVPGCKLTVTGGSEVFRTFDAFRSTGRAHGGETAFFDVHLVYSR